MAIKYYSDKLRRYYDSFDECEKAEAVAEAEEAKERERLEKEMAEKKERKEKLTAERKARAAEVEEARKKMVEAQKKYKEVLSAFINDYHTYHYSTSNFDDIPTLFDFFGNFF